MDKHDSIDRLENLKMMIDKIYYNLIYGRYYTNIAYELFKSNSIGLASMIAKSFYTSSTVYIASAYDNSNQSISLLKVLNCINTNYCNWQKYISYLNKTLNQEQLNKDLEFVNKKNPDLKSLFIERDKRVAHQDIKDLLKYKRYNKKRKEIQFDNNNETIIIDQIYSNVLIKEIINNDEIFKGLDEPTRHKLINHGLDMCVRYSHLIEHELQPIFFNEQEFFQVFKIK